MAIGVLAVFPLAAAIAMRSGLPEPDLPPAAAESRAHLRNLRLLGVSICAGALFFTFVGTFTYVTFRLEEPPFSYSVAGASLVFLLWLTGLIGAAGGRLADRIGWRRVALGTVAFSAVGVLFTMPDVLPLLVLGLACVAVGDVRGRDGARSSAISDVARVDRAPRRPSTSASTTPAARSAPTCRASPGRRGGGAASPLTGLVALAVAAAGLGRAGRGGAVGDRRDMNR